MPIHFRPHHFLCTLGFEGRGYSDSFIENFQKLSDSLRASPAGDMISITVTEATDDVCTPCPNRRETLCTQEEKIRNLDMNHMNAIGWKIGETLNWGEAKTRIKKTMSLEKFNEICAPCSWKSFGVCEKALKQLLTLMLAFFIAAPFYAHASSFSALKKLTEVENHVFKKKWDSAITSAGSIKSTEQFSDYGSYYLGLAQKKKGHFESAEKEFQRILIEFPNTALFKIAGIELSLTEIERAKTITKNKKKSRLLFERAFSRLLHSNELFRVDAKALKAYTQVCDSSCTPWYLKLAQQFPKASLEAEAMGVAYGAKSEVSRPSYTRTSQTYKSPDADQTAFEQALFLFLSNEKKKAKEAFTSFLEQFPKSQSRHRARYLLGKLAISDNQATLAHEAFERTLKEAPLTYYGLASAFELLVPVEQAFTAEMPDQSNEDPNLTPQEILRVQRTESLLKAKAFRTAALEAKDLKPRDLMSSSFLYYLADLEAQCENHSVVFQHLNELIQRGEPKVYSSHTLQLVFPTPYWKEIQDVSKQLELDPLLVLSLTKQESAFDPMAYSSSGAMGMMQLMPFTAIDVSADLTRMDLFDATLNIKTGATYLKRLLSKYQGNWAKSLAAYNAGPGAVDRWVREGKADKDLFYFIEAIPYKETQGYVAAIARNYYWYSSRIYGEKITGFQKFWQQPEPKENKK